MPHDNGSWRDPQAALKHIKELERDVGKAEARYEEAHAEAKRLKCELDESIAELLKTIRCETESMPLYDPPEPPPTPAEEPKPMAQPKPKRPRKRKASVPTVIDAELVEPDQDLVGAQPERKSLPYHPSPE
jgi:hypothetical protein